MSCSLSHTAVLVHTTQYSWGQPSSQAFALLLAINEFVRVVFQGTDFPKSELVPIPWVMKQKKNLIHKY